jgi:hypothetical protein
MSQTHGLDELRGKQSRSGYLRELLDLAIGRKILNDAYLDEATAPVPDARKSGGMITPVRVSGSGPKVPTREEFGPTLTKEQKGWDSNRMIRVESIKKVVPEECNHTWERAGSIFDRCTKCDSRKRH